MAENPPKKLDLDLTSGETVKESTTEPTRKAEQTPVAKIDVAPDQRRQDKILKSFLSAEEDLSKIMESGEVKLTPEERSEALKRMGEPGAEGRMVRMIDQISNASGFNRAERYSEQAELLKQEAKKARQNAKVNALSEESELRQQEELATTKARLEAMSREVEKKSGANAQADQMKIWQQVPAGVPTVETSQIPSETIQSQSEPEPAVSPEAKELETKEYKEIDEKVDERIAAEAESVVPVEPTMPAVFRRGRGRPEKQEEFAAQLAARDKKVAENRAGAEAGQMKTWQQTREAPAPIEPPPPVTAEAPVEIPAPDVVSPVPASETVASSEERDATAEHHKPDTDELEVVQIEGEQKKKEQAEIHAGRSELKNPPEPPVEIAPNSRQAGYIEQAKIIEKEYRKRAEAESVVPVEPTMPAVFRRGRGRPENVEPAAPVPAEAIDQEGAREIIGKSEAETERSKLRELVGRLVGNAKENVGVVAEKASGLFNRSREFLANRLEELDAQAKENGETKVELLFTNLGEKYNKLPTWQKIALGSSLAVGFGLTSSIPAVIYGFALVGTRFASLAGAFRLNQAKLDRISQGQETGWWNNCALNKWLASGSETDRKNKAMAKSLLVSFGLMGGAYAISHMDVPGRLANWLYEHNHPEEIKAAGAGVSVPAAEAPQPAAAAGEAAQPAAEGVRLPPVYTEAPAVNVAEAPVIQPTGEMPPMTDYDAESTVESTSQEVVSPESVAQGPDLTQEQLLQEQTRLQTDINSSYAAEHPDELTDTSAEPGTPISAEPATPVPVETAPVEQGHLVTSDGSVVNTAENGPVDVGVPEQLPGTNAFGIKVPIAEAHIYAGTEAGDTIVFGGSPVERAKSMMEYFIKNPDKVIFAPSDDGKYSVPYSLVGGELTAGKPIQTGGFLGFFSSFMKAPGPDDLKELIK